MPLNSASRNEKELLRRVAQSDAEAFRILFECYWDKVYSAAFLLCKSTELAEDIAQDVFTQLWSKRSDLEKIESLENYLFIMARNRILSRLRREALSQSYHNYLKLYFREDADASGNLTEYNEVRKLLLHGIIQMPPQQQRAFRLSRFDGLNHQEIAREMQVSQQTVKTYIVKSLAFLRKYMQENAVCLGVLLLSRNYF